MTTNFVFKPDLAAKKIYISCEFSAPIEKVWRAWTEAELLDKWFAPKPYKVETKIMNFTVGGIWLYAMVSPEGQKNWTHVEFTAIENCSAISSINRFSDEEGSTVADAPKSFTETKFSVVDSNKTKVDLVKTFTHEASIKLFVEMGFEKGTMAGYNQLSELLASEQV